MFGKNTFRGGAHPHDEKHWTANKAIQNLPLPEKVIIPLQQHIGAPPEIVVKKGDEVKTGQLIAKASQFVSASVHASISGKITDIAPLPHPLGLDMLSVVIESDGKDSWISELNIDDHFMSLETKEMKSRIADAGIAGMGGAAFPSHVKLSPPDDKKIDTLILNGVECEPFLTSDHRLMLEAPDQILQGLLIIQRILRARRIIIGIEKNKPDAIRLIRDKIRDVDDMSVVPLEIKYPQGAEKQLINAATGRTVPSGKLPMEVGCVVHNVGTAAAIYDAVSMKKPLIERIVTVTGHGVRDPKNLRVRIGTPFHDLISFCGGYTTSAAKVINGGPMMGIAQYTDEVPVIKGTSGILVLDQKKARLKNEKPCIACARCVDVCPMKLLPNHICAFIEHKRINDAKKAGMLDCMECGTCSFICPTNRNLVHYIKLGKAYWNENRQKAG